MHYVYILECSDGTLYTGWTTHLEERIQMHNSGKGAKYTRGRGPLELVFSEECASWSDALKRERQIKSLSKDQKEKLITVIR